MTVVALHEQKTEEKLNREKTSRRWLTHTVMSIALGLIALEITIVNVALPAIQRDLAASTTGLQWIVEAYVLVFAGVLLMMGASGSNSRNSCPIPPAGHHIPTCRQHANSICLVVIGPEQQFGRKHRF